MPCGAQKRTGLQRQESAFESPFPGFHVSLGLSPLHCFIMYKRYRTRGADTRGVRGARWEEFTGQTVHRGQGSSTRAISIGQAGQEGVKNEIQASQIAGRCGGVVHLLISPQGHSACNKIYVQELDPSSAGALRVQSSLLVEGSQWRPLAARPGSSHMRQEQGSVPAVVFDHVVEFNDVLPLFVLLAALEGLFLKRGEKTSSLEQRLYQKGSGLGSRYDWPPFTYNETGQRSPTTWPQDTELVNDRAKFLTNGTDRTL